MSEQSSMSAENPALSPQQAGAAALWNQPGFAGLWGLATAKDSLRYWFKTKSFHCAGLARWLFTIFFVMAALNGFVVFNRVLFQGKRVEMPTHAYAAVFVLLVVLAFTKERSRGVYIWSAWAFWLFYALIGFVNPTGITMENFRLVLQSLGKSWINLIVVPWMAFRVISPDKLPGYTKLLVLTAVAGSIMCFIQIVDPRMFAYIRDSGTLRAAATWGNSNHAGIVLMLALLLSRLVAWRNIQVKWAVYLLLLAGLISTFSRGALIGYVFGELVYLLIVKNYKRIFFSGAFLLVFLGSWITFGIMVQNKTIVIESKEIRDRAQTFSKLFSNQVDDEITQGRMYLWKAGIYDVVNDGSLLFGLGHVGMVKTKTVGLAPHNDYVQFFADGGLLGLGAFLAFLGMFVYIFWSCKDQTIRASLLSMIVAYAVFCMAGDKNFLIQPIGPYIAIMVLWAHYSRDYPGAEKVQRLKRALTQRMAYAQALGTAPQTANPG